MNFKLEAEMFNCTALLNAFKKTFVVKSAGKFETASF